MHTQNYSTEDGQSINNEHKTLNSLEVLNIYLLLTTK